MTAALPIGKTWSGRTKPFSLALIKDLGRAADIASVIAAWGLACLLTLGERRPFQPEYLGALVILALLSSLVFTLAGCYRDGALFDARHAFGTIRPWLAATAIALVMAFCLKISSEFSRVWATTWFVCGAFLLVGQRILFAHGLEALASRGYVGQRVLIVGAGESGRRLAERLRQDKVRFRVLGFVDDRRTRVPEAVDGLPVIGPVRDLVPLVRQEQIDEVFVALPGHAEARIREIVDQLAVLPVRTRLAPDLAHYFFASCPMTTVAGLPLLKVHELPISGWSYVIKSAFDRTAAAILLVATLPLMAIIAVAIKLETPGPVFFRQPRRGFNNKIFKVWKFRTMSHDAVDLNCDRQTTKDDARVTKVGRILRRTSLDELPQLLNVLSGEMSLVGPRPHAIGTKAGGRPFVEAVDKYLARYQVKPGITGWAQVNGWRGETDTLEKLQKRLEHDLHYIEHWSLFLDIRILLKTALLIAVDRKAY